MKFMIKQAAVASFLVTLPLATPALATDGVLEINQVCALESGCFSGDGPGFPITISANAAGRSYRLTSDLDLSSFPGTTAIQIDIDGISIDLNGFELRGPVSCSGVGVSLECTPAVGGSGISGASQIAIHNGRIVGFGSGGISLLSGRISAVVLEQNGGTGINLGTSGFSLSHGSSISDCVATSNGGAGFILRFGNIRNSIAISNRGSGIVTQAGGVVLANKSEFNGDHGIDMVSTTAETLASENSVTRNTGSGIIAHNGALIQNNLVNGNGADGIIVDKGGIVRGNTVFGNASNGIRADSSSLVSENAVRENGGFGLFFFGSQSNYHGNVISVNTGGTVGFGPGNSAINTGQNTCNNSTVCP